MKCTPRIQTVLDSGKDLPPLGEPPQTLTSDEKEAWNLISKNSYPGVLRQSDCIAVELASRQYALFKKDLINKSKQKILKSILFRLGMTSKTIQFFGL